MFGFRRSPPAEHSHGGWLTGKHVPSTASVPLFCAVITSFGRESRIVIRKREDELTAWWVSSNQVSYKFLGWKRGTQGLLQLGAGGNEEAWHRVVVLDEFRARYVNTPISTADAASGAKAGKKSMTHRDWSGHPKRLRDKHVPHHGEWKLTLDFKHPKLRPDRFRRTCVWQKYSHQSTSFGGVFKLGILTAKPLLSVCSPKRSSLWCLKGVMRKNKSVWL